MGDFDLQSLVVVFRSYTLVKSQRALDVFDFCVACLVGDVAISFSI